MDGTFQSFMQGNKDPVYRAWAAKKKKHYEQKAQEAAWMLNHIVDAERKLYSGDPALQSQGAKEKEKYQAKWENWARANPEEASMVRKEMSNMKTAHTPTLPTNDDAKKTLVGWAVLGSALRQSNEAKSKICPECKQEGLLPLNEQHTAWGCGLCGYNSEY